MRLPDAAEFLVKGLQAHPFASIDPEEFYNFSEVRPHVTLREGLYREISWPKNTFSYSTTDALRRNIIIGVGIEPHLKWKTYCAAILDLVKQCGASMVITLGALLADVSYSRPTRVIGFSSDPELAARIQVTPSRYEGPTGIVGVFNDACRQAGVTSASFWANVPHYISATPNPKAALALIGRLESFLQFSMDTNALNVAAIDFDKKVAEAVAGNPNMAAYVKQLEESEQEEGIELETAPKPNGGNGHANGHDIENALQRFLQQRKSGDDEEE